MSRATAMIIALLMTWPSSATADMVEIPAGSFIMGSDAATDAAPQRQVELPAFAIDRYEVTNTEFRALFPDHAFPRGAEEHPVALVSWEEAKRFCEIVRKRLPTEEDWEKAARGTEGFTYPWGNAAPREKPHPFISGLVKRRVGFNKIDVSVYGAHDMAGSVWEWTGSAAGGKRVARGGLWNFHLDYEYGKTYERNLIAPENRFPFLGFRCAQ